jgi:predicted permease
MQIQIIENLLNNQFFLMVLVGWELVWKGLALWKASKVGQKVFFVAILLFNTIGLLPIAYLVYRRLLEKKTVTPIA